MARKRDDTIKLVLRLPPALHRRLGRAAARNNQSLNSEMIRRLEESIERDPTLQSTRAVRKMSDLFAQRGRTEIFGRPLAEINEKLDKLIAALESEDDGDEK
jgi:hypothetical protein